jgi:hypothetical protein
MGMKLNSDRALEIGRELYQRYGGDWSKVRAAGVVRPDGVIDLTGTSLKTGNNSPPGPQTPRPARKR